MRVQPFPNQKDMRQSGNLPLEIPGGSLYWSMLTIGLAAILLEKIYDIFQVGAFHKHNTPQAQWATSEPTKKRISVACNFRGGTQTELSGSKEEPVVGWLIPLVRNPPFMDLEGVPAQQILAILHGTPPRLIQPPLFEESRLREPPQYPPMLCARASLPSFSSLSLPPLTSQQRRAAKKAAFAASVSHSSTSSTGTFVA